MGSASKQNLAAADEKTVLVPLLPLSISVHIGATKAAGTS